jgi:hypothetical protein
MLPVEKSNEFKSGEYGGQKWNSANSRWAVLAVQASAESAKRHIFLQAMSLWTQGTICILCEKLLEVVGVYTFAGENHYRRRKSAAKSACTASFRLLAVTSGSGRHLGAFSF